MKIKTEKRLKYEIESRKRFLKALRKEISEQEKKYGEVQTREEIEKLHIRFRKLNNIETRVSEEILSIIELLELGIEEIENI